MKKVCLLLGALLFFLQMNASHAQEFSLLHTFGTNSDGRYPYSGLTLCNGILYGVTFQGGTDNSGTVFSVCTNGSNYTVLYSLIPPDDGKPTAGPVVSGEWLYGGTYGGGTNFMGSIYCLRTNGSNFSVLHSFDNGTNGANPTGLSLVDGTLFGTTGSRGETNSGDWTIFSISTNGSDFKTLHVFSGVFPQGTGLTFSPGTIYGLVSGSSSNTNGFAFSLSTNGSNFTILHQFKGTDGSGPRGILVVCSNTLYGTTFLGGSNGGGTIFTMTTNGSNFRQLYAFQSPTVAPNGPFNNLTLYSNRLYGMASYGMNGGQGALFSIGTDGSDYQDIYDFPASGNGGTNFNGAVPTGDLIVLGLNVYGITSGGGTNAWGTLYEISLPPPFSTPPFFSGAVALDSPGWYWLGPQGSDTNGFGYFSAAYAPYILHEDLGWEYFLDAANPNRGGYFYDFTNAVWFYSEPGMFPYLYDFNLNAWMYCAPQDGTIDRYQSKPRWFYNFSTQAWTNNL